MLARGKATSIYAISLFCLVVDWYLSRTGDRELQAVVDHFPVTKVDWSVLYFLKYGPYRPAQYPPELLHHFDWLLDLFDAAHKLPRLHWMVQMTRMGTPERQNTKDPETIFATAYALPRILFLAERDFDIEAQKRVLVLGGSDQLLSEVLGHNSSERVRTMTRVRRYFKKVFFEAKDIAVSGVQVMPRGLSEHYLRKANVPDLLAAVASADVKVKSKNALLAFDYFSTLAGQPDWVNERMVGAASSLAKLSRLQSWVFANTTTAQEAGVEVRQIPYSEWWSSLASYRFLLCPLGNGIVPPKLLEALLVLTIPIVQRLSFPAFDDLVGLGFPVVVVDSWEEATAERMRSWWEELSPRLAAFRRRCLTSEGYWRVFTGQVERCG